MSSQSSKLLITGANGFIGQYLCDYLIQQKQIHANDLVKVVRNLPEINKNNYLVVGEIDQHTDWQQALKGVDTIIHLAARVHVMKETSDDPLKEFRKTNLQGTLNLAQQAIKAGVKRFIYLSTIKVNGEKTTQQPFYADDRPCDYNKSSLDGYALSKQEAESALLDLHRQQQIEVVIIRPPLVYGPGVKGNFARLISLIKKQYPLPLAGIENKRSLVSIDNLCSLISCCIVHKKAPGEVFLVSDGEDISSSQLMDEIAQVLECNNRLFKLPAQVLKIIALSLGKKAEYQRLFESLRVDISKNKDLLNWTPQLSLKQALKIYFFKP